MRATLALAAALAPALAQACPYCVRDAGPLGLVFIAGMIGAPYLVGYLAVRAIRQLDRPDAAGEER